MKYSVIMLCHRRFRILEDTLKFWLSQPKVDDVIVLDNSGTFKTDLPITLLSSNKNLGPGARIPLVGYAKNDGIIFCDDDIELKDGIIEDLEKYWDENTVCGIMGKQFNNKQYLKAKHISGLSLKKPLEVDYMPYNLALYHRRWLTRWDIKRCPEYFFLDDLWLSFRIVKSKGRLLTIPTKNYVSLKENNDSGAMWRRKDLHAIRQEYLDRWFFKGEKLP